jgi:hypothetical protein
VNPEWNNFEDYQQLQYRVRTKGAMKMEGIAIRN